MASVRPAPTPPTQIIDVPLASGPTWFILIGGFVALGGLWVRYKARQWAWPRDWSYSGDRATTVWAYNEGLYIDLGLMTLAFGLVLILLGIARATDPTAKK